MGRRGASAENSALLSGTRERTSGFQVSENVDSHFKNGHKNVHKKARILKSGPVPEPFLALFLVLLCRAGHFRYF